ncbi:class I SAM-dependent methyltransferase [Sunxiuqinia sp. A32]|uniref:class I SAM-dependent methyltransferase n=1 Tax=Sunxiuqinia sp. A32 TaxID=3461496 RepID=UPI0040467309
MFLCTTHLGCNPKNYKQYAADGELSYLKCNDCGLIWRSPDSFNLEKEYDQSYFKSKKYDLKRKHKVRKSGWLIDIASLFHSNITSLLEVGCSIGYTLEAARDREISHLGIDVSEYAVDYCQSQGLNAEVSSLEELISKKKKYQLIYMQHVLEHFPNPFTTLAKCADLLNKNGIILIMVPNSKYNRAQNNRGEHRFYNQAGVGLEHFVYFNYENLGSTLESSGFEVVQQNYPVFIPGPFSFKFFFNRFFRRILNVFNIDQEVLVVARKI